MGEVYRARDPRLGRDVAIKVLPGSLSSDPERLARFEQEARAAGALNHPNILAVHEINYHDGAPFIVSELLDGETLRERLAHGLASDAHAGVPVRRAIDYAIQVARGLAAAHEKGIVHRDLKPENIFITHDGQVKILDFGLAKLTEPAVPAGALTTVPTKPMQTVAGVILGTLHYMAPEQVRGVPVDHRADIFAFGAVLYEMLSGRQAYAGDTATDIAIAIVKEDPQDLPAERHIPPALERIVNRCLEKSQAARFQTAADLAFALSSLSMQSDRQAIDHAIALPPQPRKQTWWPWVAAMLGIALLGTGAVTILHVREKSASPAPVTFEFAPREGDVIDVALSPDGQQIVFVASVKGVPALWLRSLATVESRRLAGTEGAARPFWSPDGKSIGFNADRKLKRIQAAGGQPLVICDAAAGTGATWSSENQILFTTGISGGGLYRVSASGGAPEAITTPTKGESHRFPWFLPDGRHFLYLVDVGGTGTIHVRSLDSKEERIVGQADSSVAYASGHLLFSRQGTLFRRPFDTARNVPTAEPVPLTENVRGMPTAGAFSVSQTGMLAYVQRGSPVARLAWFDRAGRVLESVGDPGAFNNLALSADQTRLAVSRASGTPPNFDIWLADLTRAGAFSRLTFDEGPDFDPTFSPDASEVVFSSFRNGSYRLFRRKSNGSGQDELLDSSIQNGNMPDWSRDGRFVVFSAEGDLWVLPMQGERKASALQKTPFLEGAPAFSPDGRWIAYRSNESGRFEIYVQPFPATGAKYLVSRNGGLHAAWRGDGQELFFLSPTGTLMASTIKTTPDFQAGIPQALFETEITGERSNHAYVVSKDGKRFLMAVRERSASTPMTVILNWPGLFD